MAQDIGALPVPGHQMNQVLLHFLQGGVLTVGLTSRSVILATGGQLQRRVLQMHGDDQCQVVHILVNIMETVRFWAILCGV